eukprot:3775582-Rhodomonas_salina.3
MPRIGKSTHSLCMTSLVLVVGFAPESDCPRGARRHADLVVDEPPDAPHPNAHPRFRCECCQQKGRETAKQRESGVREGGHHAYLLGLLRNDPSFVFAPPRLFPLAVQFRVSLSAQTNGGADAKRSTMFRAKLPSEMLSRRTGSGLSDWNRTSADENARVCTLPCAVYVPPKVTEKAPGPIWSSFANTPLVLSSLSGVHVWYDTIGRYRPEAPPSASPSPLSRMTLVNASALAEKTA